MARFKFEVNVTPEDIPGLDNSHKRDCADALRGVIDSAFKYTLIMTLGVMAFYGAYAVFGLVYLLRQGELLTELFALLPIAALAAFVLEFPAGAMYRWALVPELLLDIGIAVSAAARWPSIWIVPFALYGAFLHFKLLTLVPIHKALSEQKGYPEFPAELDSGIMEKPEGTREPDAAEKREDTDNDSPGK